MYRAAGICFLMLGLASPSNAQRASDSTVASPTQQYPAGPLHRLLLGSHYRDLWSLEIAVPVLDLNSFAGGLVPTGTGGGLQTRSLRFAGADGKRYTFRVIDKDAARTLDPDLRQTIAARVLQDQVSALLPGSALVVAPLLEAAGVLHADPSLYVMPDDPGLGEFRADFATLLGYVEERPDEGPDGEPGFAGATWIINSNRLADSLEAEPRHVFDDRAFVRARLLDAFVGDWDRHPDQWLWAGFPEGPRTRWVPIPRDRDWALTCLDGLLVWAAGFAFPNYKGFDETYASAFRLSWTGRALDRMLLSGTARAVWDSVAADLVNRLTDDVITAAVRRLPPEYYERVGPSIEQALLARRDALPDHAREYYRLLAGWVDIHMTDVDEIAEVVRIDDAHVQVVVASLAGDRAAGPPHFSRTFDAAETREIRLFLHGGNDRAVVRGGASGGIAVRIIGGGGDDTLADRTNGSGVYFYDDRGNNRFEPASHTRVDPSTFVQRLAGGSQTANAPARDWGSWWVPLPNLAYDPDAGWYFAGGAIRYGYGFRYYPWKTRLAFTAGFGTAAARFRGNLSFDFPLAGQVRGRLAATVSGIDSENFHGFGNESSAELDRQYYRANRTRTGISFAAAVQPTPSLDLSIGPLYRRSHPFGVAGTLLDSLDVYGEGEFEEAGIAGHVLLDRRNRRSAASRGFSVRLDGRYFPDLLDVTSHFGAATAIATAFVSPDTAGAPVLAVRLGGEKVWGNAPFQEAAYIGGAETMRGFSNRRFAGDAAVYGSAELRVPVADVFITLPARLGFFGLADGGRVFLRGESSDRWHTAAGGGLFLSALGPANVLSLAVVRSQERTAFYFRAGFAY